MKGACKHAPYALSEPRGKHRVGHDQAAGPACGEQQWSQWHLGKARNHADRVDHTHPEEHDGGSVG